MGNEPNSPVEKVPQPIPVPADVVASAIRDFNESEILAAMQEIRAGNGRKLEEFLPELQHVAGISGNAPQT